MNSVLIGQYIPGDSWIHKLDPRIKLISVLLLLIATFLIPISATYQALIFIGVFFIGSLVLTATAHISIIKMLKGLRAIIILLVFTFAIQIFYTNTGTPIMEPTHMSISVTSIAAMIAIIVIYNLTKKYIKLRIIYFILAVVLFFYVQYLLPYVELTSYTLQIYDEGLLRATFIFVRIAAIIIITSLLTFTTMTTDLNYGIEALLKPLKIIKVPVDVFAMLLSLTLRYIPTLLQETEKIMKAQASRGVDFKESSLREKIMQVISLLIPVFVISFNRSEDLANAMEVKGYVIGAKRTKIDEYKMGFSDIFTLIMTCLIFAAVIIVRYTI